jgi:hypothetical protein
VTNETVHPNRVGRRRLHDKDLPPCQKSSASYRRVCWAAIVLATE